MLAAVVISVVVVAIIDVSAVAVVVVVSVVVVAIIDVSAVVVVVVASVVVVAIIDVSAVVVVVIITGGHTGRTTKTFCPTLDRQSQTVERIVCELLLFRAVCNGPLSTPSHSCTAACQ